LTPRRISNKMERVMIQNKGLRCVWQKGLIAKETKA
jgi:hypothetical protein